MNRQAKNRKSLLFFFFILFSLIEIFPLRVSAMPRTLADLADVLPEWPMTTSEAGGIFLFSDSPEEFDRDGILYQDKAKGNIRLFFHHVNMSREKKRVAIILHNPGDQPARGEIQRLAISQPDSDYLRAGRMIQADYFKPAKPQKIEILPGKAILLSRDKHLAALPPHAISTGMVDLSTDREIRVTVAAVAEQGDPLKLISALKVLPPGKPHLRGTFRNADRLMLADQPYNPAQDGPVSITIGDGEQDRFMSGLDVTTGIKVRNEGNYGVVYRVLIPSQGSGKIRCYLNPRGGVYAGWLTVKSKVGEKLVGTPAKGISFGYQTLADFEMIAEFPAGETLWVTLSPPGASNLPVRLVLVPASI